MFTSGFVTALWLCFCPPECKIENCESCFSRNFCTKCKEGLYLHKGRCYVTCPEGYSAANGTMECSSPGKQHSGTELSVHLLLYFGLGDQTKPSGMLCWCLMGNGSGSLVPSP